MSIDSFPVLGIVLAVLSAALLTVGNLLQSRGVAARTDAGSGAIGVSQGLGLFRETQWLAGSALFGLAILVQLGALAAFVAVAASVSDQTLSSASGGSS